MNQTDALLYAPEATYGEAQETRGNIAFVPEKTDRAEAPHHFKAANFWEASSYFKTADNWEAPDKCQTSDGCKAATAR